MTAVDAASSDSTVHLNELRGCAQHTVMQMLGQ